MDDIVFDEFEAYTLQIRTSFINKIFYVPNIPKEEFYNIIVKVKYRSLICDKIYEDIVHYRNDLPIAIFSFCKIINVTFKFKNKSEMIKFKLKYL